ncbi:PAS-domain containing protein [Sulfitobacter aestuarii]|uniref:PAS-domain containing protein n=1 Tax=Sulfitobacter aestuarii TaxID=2161676 RepID=A0ABW5U5W3_9RHOB
MKKRVSLPGEGAELPAWYEVTPVILDEATVFHANCVNAVVTAEVAQRNFVQTLAKTFAHLSIGLAIFDRNGQLALFNPALIDLTALPAQFLSTRPTMISFFDQLRENRHMPEPKNYLNWRQEITAVIAAAEDGRYEEIWTLDSGRTYRVRGRPHPDGATAFLIEDISAEVALTRNFRADLELCQSLLDTLEDGLALFSVSGVLTFSNARYRSLWCLNPQATFADVTITDSIDAWRQLCAPNPMWRDIEDSVLNLESCENWHMPLRLRNGEALICHIAPVATGATLIRFQQITPEPDLPVIARERSLD